MTNTPHDDEALRKELLNHPRVATTNYADIPNYQQLITIPLQDLMQLIKARDEQREREILDKLMETAREYHEKYPDADYFDFAGLVAGMRITNPNQQTGEK